jgi:formate hydrogenlyase transcriptional activator
MPNSRQTWYKKKEGRGAMKEGIEKKHKFLLEINNAIVNKVDRNSLFNALSKEMKLFFQHDRFSINLYDRDKNTLSYFSSADGVKPKWINKNNRPLSQGSIAKHVIEEKKTLVIEDLSKYQNWSSAKSMSDSGLVSTIACPLLMQGEPLGSIHISFKKKPENINGLAELLSEVSDQVAIAVDNMLVKHELQVLNRNLQEQKRYLMQEIEDDYSLQNFFFVSDSMRQLMSQIDMLAETDEPILITGETGTGKDYIARCIHNMSHRRNAMFVKISCPALVPSLFETELFGHAKGAFTGAQAKKVGRIEMAEGGTVFFDEIGELPLSLQPKLLQVLQEMTFERVGESSPIRANFRIIAASNKDLKASIEENVFRPDLYYRINTFSMHIPSLRERKEDIKCLINNLNIQESKRTNKKPPYYSEKALEILKKYHWPGNVRELKNLVKRLTMLRSGSEVTAEDVKKIIDIDQGCNLGNEMSLDEVEKKHIERVLQQTSGKLSGSTGAANVLGLPRTTLQYRIRKHGIDLGKFKKA